MTFVFEGVIPSLKQAGATDAQIDQMMLENPKRWLGR
jgi:predicted metal-dependent phosphotriesterase family hydrolase